MEVYSRHDCLLHNVFTTVVENEWGCIPARLHNTANIHLSNTVKNSPVELFSVITVQTLSVNSFTTVHLISSLTPRSFLSSGVAFSKDICHEMTLSFYLKNTSCQNVILRLTGLHGNVYKECVPQGLPLICNQGRSKSLVLVFAPKFFSQNCVLKEETGLLGRWWPNLQGSQPWIHCWPRGSN